MELERQALVDCLNGPGRRHFVKSNKWYEGSRIVTDPPIDPLIVDHFVSTVLVECAALGITEITTVERRGGSCVAFFMGVVEGRSEFLRLQVCDAPSNRVDYDSAMNSGDLRCQTIARAGSLLSVTLSEHRRETVRAFARAKCRRERFGDYDTRRAQEMLRCSATARAEYIAERSRVHRA